MPGRILVISGPSGSGKSTIIRRLVDVAELEFSVSATTRDPRPGEVDGQQYWFVSREDFQQMLEDDQLLEWAVYNGNYYGTPAQPIEDANALDMDVLLDIEIHGARQVKAHRPSAMMIFIAPPSLEEMARRLRHRGDTSEADIEDRLRIAEGQLTEAPELFDYIVINDDLEAAVEAVINLVTAGE